MSTSSKLTPEMRSALDQQFHAIRDSANSPEGLGWAIVNYALTNAASQGTLNGDRLEIPMVASISLPPAQPPAGSTDAFAEVETCHDVCVSVSGVELFCFQRCETHIIHV
jgi:hypothetical protein